MPRGDRTGPFGQGPRTGRGMGYCAGYPVPGFMNPGPGFGFWGFWGLGRGWGRGWPGGRGRGWRHWYYATGLPGWARFGAFVPGAYPPPPPPPSPPGVPREQEVEWLRRQARILQDQLEAINKRLGELEAKEKEAEQ